MPIRIDLHVHSMFSADAVNTPEELIAAARARGLNGFAITDHNTCDAVEYLLRKGLMRPDGQPVDGFLVIPGVEVTTADGHILCIGATLPDLKGRPAALVVDEIHARGGLAIPPHAYDLFRAGIREDVLDTLDIDALEVFNAATTFRRHNSRALAYAGRRGLPMTSASDAHSEEAVGIAHTILQTLDLSVQGVLRQVVRENPLHQEYLSTRATIRKTWNNLFRLRKRPNLDALTPPAR